VILIKKRTIPKLLKSAISALQTSAKIAIASGSKRQKNPLRLKIRANTEPYTDFPYPSARVF
jgi:hypothetical protein